MKVMKARYPIQNGGSVSHVFYGSPYQKGHGLGSLLGGLFRTVIPWIKSGARTLGQQAVNTGGDILRDVVKGRPLSDAARDHIIKGGQKLTDKVSQKLSSLQRGRGIKRKAESYKGCDSIKKPHSMRAASRGRLTSKTLKRKPDIFDF